MADSADTAVRAITTAIVRPVQKVSGLAAALTHGSADFRAHRNVRAALAAVASGGTISFQAGLTGTITLASTLQETRRHRPARTAHFCDQGRC